MGVLIHTLETQEDPQGEQILIDLAMYIKAQECLRFSAEIPPTMQVMTPNLSGKVESFYYLELMTHAALMQDTAYTIGGIMSAIAPRRHIGKPHDLQIAARPRMDWVQQDAAHAKGTKHHHIGV